MATAPEQLKNIEIRNQVLLEGLKQGEHAKFAKFLRELSVDVNDRLLLEGGTIKNKQRLRTLLSDLTEIQRVIYSVYNDVLSSDLEEITIDQAEFESMALDKTVKNFTPVVPAATQLLVAARVLPLSVQGLTGKPLLQPFIKDWSVTSINRVNNLVQQGFAQGKTTNQIALEIRGTKQQKFENGELARINRDNRAIVRTAVQHVASVGRTETMRQNSDLVKGYEWVSTLDSRTTSQCRGLDGQEFKIGKGPLPPIHVNCLLGFTTILTGGSISSVSKRVYNGDIVVVTTSTGKSISCTPNHPVLSGRGWVSAQSLEIGSSVVCNGGSQWEPVIDGKADDGIPTIHDVAEAFFSSDQVVTAEMPSTSKDFHGDGINGKVNIIGTNRGLPFQIQTTLVHEIKEKFLKFRHSCKSFLVGLCSGFSGRFGLFRPSSCDMSIPSHIHPFRLRGLVPAFYHTLASISGNPIFTKDSIDRSNTDIEGQRDFFRGMSGGMALEDIVSIEIRDFSGHVYNLQSQSGYIMAEGIVTHNCRSTTVAVLDERFDFLDEGAKRPAVGEEKIGQVDASMTYYEWLKTQSVDFQNSVIGPTRGKVLRNGGLTADEFARLSLDKNFKPLTLDEMRSKRPEVFEEANV